MVCPKHGLFRYHGDGKFSRVGPIISRAQNQSPIGGSKVTEHEWLLILTSVCGHCDYKLLLGTARRVQSDDRWVAVLRNSRSVTFKHIGVSDRVSPEDAVAQVLEQLALSTTE